MWASLRPRKKMIVLMVSACALSATTLSSQLLNTIADIPFVISFSYLIIFIGLLLPLRFLWLSVPISVVLLTCFSLCNELKTRLMGLPITYADIQFVVANPLVVSDAIGINTRFWLTCISIVVIAAIILSLAIWKTFRRHYHSRPRALGSILQKVIAVLFVVFLGQQSLTRYAAYIQDTLPERQPKLWQDLWLPEGQVTLSRQIGFPEYLAFSALVGSEFSHLRSPETKLPLRSDITDAAGGFVNIPLRQDKILPNIVIMHAELTFDPNRAFNLSSRVELPLWSGVTETQALGPLHVNVIGGGSWVTAFEVLTGVDTRLFGLQGYYPNLNIAHSVKHSLVVHLSAKGYRTKVFSTFEGWMWNTRNAFKHYGFEEFIDAVSLGSPDWRQILTRVL